MLSGPTRLIRELWWVRRASWGSRMGRGSAWTSYLSTTVNARIFINLPPGVNLL
ncbi:MAG: hypothetical protein HC880_15510 [Bacteroidia bacterium]|nr:hypothetical protein [Bacteroidia bacterium]